ncbi:transglutaminaseTgpA domain-containing protein [Pelagicoccus sp. SDUM812003]|uniref:transglutaminase family protein n=1 Tax=Pelagicoccus sp. SDUM812003 TaxID=3041267 RepID=UPI00280E408D|nr:transglutaminaseTgpA domain-containing protein [Pelagicoccus sp. SDUM812003]MDQ8203300.1 transglutaminaseTgpA domain-containing protein [Pelagicoccus sp. SDUM812003]
MKSKSPRHSIEDLVTLKWMLGALMGLVCITTLFNINGYNRIPAIVSTTVIIFALFRPALIAKVPQVVWKGYAIAIIPLVMVNVISKDTIPALLDLNTWLILFRCLNHNKRREEMQLALLCLFLIIMTGVLTATLVFGIQLLAFAALAVAYLVVNTALEMKAEGDYELLERIRSENRLNAGKALRSTLEGSFILQAIIMFASMSFLAAIVFLAIPRIDMEDKVNLFNMQSKQTLSGFTDRVELGEVTDIKNDNSIALRVDVPENAEVPVEPYWRMLALDKYENGAFSLSPDLVELQNSPLASPYHSVRYWPDRRFAQAPSNIDRDKWTFFLEPEVSRYLPVIGTFEHMTVDSLSDLTVGPHMHSFAFKDINTKMVSYQIEGVDLSGTVPDVPANSYPRFLSKLLSQENRRGYGNYPQTLLAMPEEEGARSVFEGIAKEVADGRALSPLEFAREASIYLWDKHRYSMTVSLPKQSGGISDPVARWAQSDLPGHCEFFAASFVLTARAAGYPARVVTGFKGGTWNPYENYFMVRNADAHAWAEIFDGQGKWIRVDPTPGSYMPALESATQPVSQQYGEANSSAFLDSLRLLWYRRIVNYDEATQREAAVQLKDFFLAYMQVAENWAVKVGEYLYLWATAPWSVWRILYMCFLASLLVAAFVIQRNMALNLRELVLAPFRRGDPIRRKAGKLLSRIELAGAQSDFARKVIYDLQRLRFGAKEMWPNPRLVFKAARRLR